MLVLWFGLVSVGLCMMFCCVILRGFLDLGLLVIAGLFDCLVVVFIVGMFCLVVVCYVWFIVSFVFCGLE